MFNPFPGLRPFEPDEDHLFFGRESEIDELLRRLRSTRFLAVVGTSGSGKSSLVRSGLIPSLQSGFMAGAGSSWLIGILRPGEDPVGHLAGALNDAGVLGTDDPEIASTNRVLLEATLRRSSLGLTDAVRQARIPADHNVLVVVDQFEELFRFRRSRLIANSRDEAVAFVRLLLEATRQTRQPIYVVLTMRSDFIGDCMDFPGLSDAVNAGLFLVGRMGRDALRSAITGPVAVAGGTIAPRLVHRVLNDLGDDQDQLPLVQHALMRTWDHWQHREVAEPIDIADYEAVGGFHNALSWHAEEAYQEAVDSGAGTVAERVFKALTDRFSDQRGVRRPTSVAELAAIAEVPEAEIVRVVEIFRHPGRSFLTPAPDVPLTGRSIIDLSHESLMRCWTRLIGWAEEERAAAGFYVRLAQAARWFEEGTAGLWRNPELELGTRWRQETRPTQTWARRYAEGFEAALAFLEHSQQVRDHYLRERERERKLKLRRTQWVAGVLASLLLVAATMAYLAYRERNRAETNLDLARAAVDESLASAERDPAQIGADVPELEEFRRELLGKAEQFYLAFMDQQPTSEQSRRDLAYAHFRMGHINRLLERPDDAAREYRDAIGRFETLAAAYPGRDEYRQALANAYNWLGETLRLQPAEAVAAAEAYDRALEIQRALLRDRPQDAQVRQELARTLYNRGILRSSTAAPEDAEADFREAIQLLEPLADDADQAAQEMARAYNNLASLLIWVGEEAADARALYERAIVLHEGLVARNPDNREYKLELAKFCNNLAALLVEMGEDSLASARSRQAVELVESLSQPPPSLAVERADAHAMRGVILQAQDVEAAAREFQEALDLFEAMRTDPALHARPMFHLRFGDLLVNLAAGARVSAGPEGPGRLLRRGLNLYGDVVRAIVASGAPSEAALALEVVERVMAALPESERNFLGQVYEQLQQKAGERSGEQGQPPS